MSIKSIGIIIVTFILLSALISILAPKGKMENSVKFVVSLGFVFVIISTVFNLKIDLPDIEHKYTEVIHGEDIYQLSLKTTKEILISKIKMQLAKENIYLEYLAINADISEDNRIIIDSITYKTRDMTYEYLIETTIKEVTGCQNIKRENDEEYITEQGN